MDDDIKFFFYKTVNNKLEEAVIVNEKIMVGCWVNINEEFNQNVI